MTGRLDRAQPYAIGMFRIVVGLLFACHGAASCSAFSAAPTAAEPSPPEPGPAGTPPSSSSSAAAW